jgi:hypothetical protein
MLVPLDELKKAAARIGDGKQQLRWALALADEDVAGWGAGRLQDLRVELTMFRHGSRWLADLPDLPTACLPSWFHSEEQARRVHERFVTFLASYARDNQISMMHKGATHFSLRGSHFSFGVGDPVTACCIKLMQLMGEFSSHLRRCPPGQGCGKWFLGKKTDTIFCSKTCAGRKRAFEFRQRQQRKAGKQHGRKAR